MAEEQVNMSVAQTGASPGAMIPEKPAEEESPEMVRELSWNEVVQLLERAMQILRENEEKIEKAKNTDEENEIIVDTANELCALFDEYKLPKYNFLFNNEAEHLEIHIPAFWINKNKRVWFEVTPYKFTMIDNDASIELIEKHYVWSHDNRNPAFSFLFLKEGE